MVVASNRLSTYDRTFTGINMSAFLTGLVLLTLMIFIQPAKAMDIKTVTSPGGIKAWLVQESTVPLIALKFAFNGGSSQDPDNKAGRAKFLSAMLDEGAGELDSGAFQERMEEIAMRMSFDDSRDNFLGSFQTLTANRQAAADLLKLAITKPRFDNDAVERMRRQLKASLAYAARNPKRVAPEAWFKIAFPNHPYGRSPNGTPDSLDRIQSSDLEQYRSSIFAKDNLKIVAVGDIDEQTLGQLLDHVFGDLPQSAKLKDIPKTKLPVGGIQNVIEMDVPQSVAVFGMGSVARKDPDFMPAFVLNHIIGGGGFSSKLMEEVREKRGLAYSVYSYHNPLDSAAIFMGSVATKNESIAESLKVIRDELSRMADVGPTQEDLDNAKKYLTGSYPLRFDTNSKIASQMLGILVEDMGINYVKDRNKMIEVVTLEDLRRAAKRFLNVSDLIVTVVGKPKGMGPRG